MKAKKLWSYSKIYTSMYLGWCLVIRKCGLQECDKNSQDERFRDKLRQ